jgi:hypothetical protein
MDPAKPGQYFVTDGTVEAWDPVTRVLKLALDGRRFIVSPAIRLTFKEGQRVTVSGHGTGDEWTVTQGVPREPDSFRGRSAGRPESP